MPSKRSSVATSRKTNEKTNKRALEAQYRAVNQRQPWRPGSTRTPWLGIGALIITIIALATSVGILVGSDKAPISSWRFQPTVYLAIATTAANICLQTAFAEGVIIRWWRAALRGTTVGELHRIHHYGTNFWGAAFAWPYTNLITIACIFVTISPVNGPLMQRASQVLVDADSFQRTLRFAVATDIPPGYTAYTTGRDYVASTLTREFAPIVQAWDNQSPVPMKKTGCSGSCRGTLHGAGFAVNCTSHTKAFNMTLPFTGELPDNWPELVPSAKYFEIAFSQPMGFLPFASNIGVAYKNTTACVGQIQIRNCTIQPATVKFPVTIDGTTNSISLTAGTSIFDDEIVKIPHYSNDTVYDDGKLGGLYMALSQRYTSSASLSAEPVKGAIATVFGFPASQYAVVSPSYNSKNGTSPNDDCHFSYGDPLMDLLNAARDLSFRTAIAAANKSSDMQKVQVTESTNEPRYHSSYLFLGLAILATLIPAIFVCFTFNEYWRIGRKVSMSPIETAKAFNAPGLHCKDSNATVRTIVHEIGLRQVRYGGVNSATTSECAKSEVNSEDGIDINQNAESEDVPRLRLQMKSPQFVLTPLRGWIFAG